MDTPFVRATPARDPLIGRVLHDRYKVEKRIGKGGMGIVYLAEHVLLRRKVALKTLSDRAFASEELVARFHREAMAAAAVGSAHIVDVTDMGQLDDGSYFIVLEYLDGAELAFAVADQGPFPIARAVHVVSQLCDALTAVHAAGIVHRDLKPENLFLVEREGEPDFLKVLDFGVCKVFEDQARSNGPLTRTGASLGTPQFMAPEQIDGSEWADQRADIYAAGAILYFALTGQAPFQSASLPQLLIRVSIEPPPSLHALRPDLPPALDAVIARALQKKPEDRYQTSGELRAALQPFATLRTDAPPARVAAPVRGSAPTVSAFTVAYSVPPQRSWRPRGARAYAAAGVVLACAVAAFSLWSSGRSSRGESAVKTRPRGVLSAAAASAPPASAAIDTPALQPAVGVDVPASQVAVGQAAPGDSAKGAATDAAHTARARRTQRERDAIPPSQPSPEPSMDGAAAVEQPAASTTPVQETGTAPAPPKNGYRLSQRGLKDVFP